MASALVCCGALGAGVAQADGGDSPQRREPSQHQQNQRNEQRYDSRQLDPRSYEARAEEQRRAMQEASRNAELNRRVGRMTPDERRDLRRQINEVGQDLYANPPRR
ncbi:hypothetical protein FHW83_000443 [Duganella sp. SG902]|uniref:hypothetical protein n=1 Tax=Duganella sp. SG902 TaxID=2587016 RepID=UPI0017D58AAB|nr:hypothetical protein [Duganella sp. SG902]NVM74683.1 hypothetical protein [Duganella sp. SG902]